MRGRGPQAAASRQRPTRRQATPRATRAARRRPPPKSRSILLVFPPSFVPCPVGGAEFNRSNPQPPWLREFDGGKGREPRQHQADPSASRRCDPALGSSTFPPSDCSTLGGLLSCGEPACDRTRAPRCVSRPETSKSPRVRLLGRNELRSADRDRSDSGRIHSNTAREAPTHERESM